MKIERADAAYRQIFSQMKERIDRSEWGPGHKLPATDELARTFGVAPHTVQKSLSMLKQRGLISRLPGRGTFVSTRKDINTIGIVFGANILEDAAGDYSFFRLYASRFAEECLKVNIRTSLYIPLSIESAHMSVLFDRLDHDIKEGHIDAIAAACQDASLGLWLQRHCAVPWTNKTGAMDMQAMGKMGIRYLLERNYSRIGIIAHGHEAMKNEFLAGVRQGADGDEDCFTVLPTPLPSKEDGYVLAKELFGRQAGDRPEVIFLNNDNICAGLLAYVIENRISIPDELAILTYTNKGRELVSPVPLTRFEFDPATGAKYAAGHLLHLARGDEDSANEMIHPELVIGRSCGEE